MEFLHVHAVLGEQAKYFEAYVYYDEKYFA